MGGEGHSVPGRPPRMKNLGTLSSTVDTYNFLIDHCIIDGTFKDIELGDTITIIHNMPDTYSNFYYTGSTVSEFYIAGFDFYWGKNPEVYEKYKKHRLTLLSKKSIGFGDSTSNSAWIYHPVYKFLNTKYMPALSNVMSTSNYLMNSNRVCLANSMSTSVKSMLGNNLDGATSMTSSSWEPITIPTIGEWCGSGIYTSYMDTNYCQILPLFNIMPLNYFYGSTASYSSIRGIGSKTPAYVSNGKLYYVPLVHSNQTRFNIDLGWSDIETYPMFDIGKMN